MKKVVAYIAGFVLGYIISYIMGWNEVGILVALPLATFFSLLALMVEK